MEKSQSTAEISKAIVAVMKEVKGIDKSMTVGTGKNAYQGVSDKDVKNAIGKAMENNGLVIVPTEITPTCKVDRWGEADPYNNGAIKQKQSVFTEVKTKYLLLHVSGEWIEMAGYGHGVDTQDKSAGKATTYAMKNTLLYAFMVPTGKIDDADNEHSEEKDVAPSPWELERRQAIVEMSASENMDQLKECWTKWKRFQKDPEFMGKKEEMKNKISQLQAA